MDIAPEDEEAAAAAVEPFLGVVAQALCALSRPRISAEGATGAGAIVAPLFLSDK
jgi:hypothetical protein